MIKGIKLISVYCIVVVLTACTSSLNVVQSLDENESIEKKFNYYDWGSTTGYWVANDSNTLHLRLEFSTKSNIAKVLHTGLTIYFDENGKKKKNVYINYPLRNTPQDFQKGKPKEMGEKGKPDQNLIISQIPSKAFFVANEVPESFDAINDSLIKINLSMTEVGNLIYDLVIPLKKNIFTRNKLRTVYRGSYR